MREREKADRNETRIKAYYGRIFKKINWLISEEVLLNERKALGKRSWEIEYEKLNIKILITAR